MVKSNRTYASLNKNLQVCNQDNNSFYFTIYYYGTLLTTKKIFKNCNKKIITRIRNILIYCFFFSTVFYNMFWCTNMKNLKPNLYKQSFVNNLNTKHKRCLMDVIHAYLFRWTVYLAQKKFYVNCNELLWWSKTKNVYNVIHIYQVAWIFNNLSCIISNKHIYLRLFLVL